MQYSSIVILFVVLVGVWTVNGVNHRASKGREKFGGKAIVPSVPVTVDHPDVLRAFKAALEELNTHSKVKYVDGEVTSARIGITSMSQSYELEVQLNTATRKTHTYDLVIEIGPDQHFHLVDSMQK